MPDSLLLAPLLAALALGAPLAAQGSSLVPPQNGIVADPYPGRAPYDVLTERRAEVTNFHPEPTRGLAVDSFGRIHALNSYAGTLLRFDPPALEPELVISTGLAPVAFALRETGPLPRDLELLVVCAGTFGAFLHDGNDGRVLRHARLDAEPSDLVLDEDNGWFYVSCAGANSVLRLSLATFELLERYTIPCGQRPGPLLLDRGVEEDPLDNRVFVASTVTGNNSVPLAATAGETVGSVFDLDGFVFADLPDEDVFRIDPFSGAVEPVVRAAGSLLFELERNPETGELWILSSDSNNKDPQLDTSAELRGVVVRNQLVTVPGVTATSTLVTAPEGLDLDDLDPLQVGGQYEATRSLNQARSLAFLSSVAGKAAGAAFIAGPLSDTIILADAGGRRVADFVLPPGAQCWDVEVLGAGEDRFLALCLGSMTVEVYQWSPYSPFSIASMPLGVDPTPARLRRGRDVFLDGRRSQDARSSCAACHPGGRSDQLGWSLRDDPCDVKDVMVTQSLRSIADTFPHQWRGERALEDFGAAFQSLLGAPEAELPDAAQLADLAAFLRSLQAPANPHQDPRRLLSDRHTVPVDGRRGSAIRGQNRFRDSLGPNGETCSACHSSAAGSDSNTYLGGPPLAPRAARLEAAHLRQLTHKEAPGVVLPMGSGLAVNQNGFGLGHDGRAPSLLAFLEDHAAPATDPQVSLDLFQFLRQFDQGISPAAHWSSDYRQQSAATTEREIERVLLVGAARGWNDVVAFGTHDLGLGVRPTRWLYQPATNTFQSDDPAVAPISWQDLQLDTRAGLAEHVFVGTPPGNGVRFGIDQDGDGLQNGAEAGFSTDPWNPDTDGDGWPDGYEVLHGDDPLVFQPSSMDLTPPVLASVPVLDHATARLAKYHVEFDEDVTYSVEYEVPGSARTQLFVQDDFCALDTFVLTHSEPSTPNFPSVLFDARITLTDRAGNVSGPFALPGFEPDSASVLSGGPLSVHVASTVFSSEVRAGDTLTAEVTVELDFDYGAPNFVPAPSRMVFCTVALFDDNTETFVQSTDFVSALDSGFDLVVDDGMGGQAVVPYGALPGGPYLVSDPTGLDGRTTLSFQQSGLVSGQRVKVSVIGVASQATAPAGHSGTVYDPLSLTQMTQLLLEGAASVALEF